MKLISLVKYTPDNPLTIPGLDINYLRDENGHDWYEAQKDFAIDTLKIAYTSDGIIRQCSTDISALWPENMSVDEIARPEAPEASLNDGSWSFDGVNLTQTPTDYVAQSTAKKAELIADATLNIDPLQDAVDLEMATDEEAALLVSWKKYRVLLSRVDTGTAPDITWPPLPE
ncbi:tail fiber assembly protein [Nissabacter sp. SGAir0207]|uniref:tail fiber assembly protein n=1 Tax=Nissabacter sp. SGAir0207 TaxID=2126321 RepID=UPI0010CD609C|nr:tail fiber assembly protein [Nissabacter sp. SGAir0207]QCR38000.1 tail fiber assembly protein [Nissabacter sp. SGAir0207]